MRLRFVLALAALVLAALSLRGQAPQPAPAADSCRTCHAIFEDRLGEAVRESSEDVHWLRGLSCSACHGGDPREEEPEKSMDPRKGYLGVPRRADIPRLCARCHSDAAFMRGYNPSLRTDQLAQYRTSVHGQRLAQGDTRAAVCTDCHGIHNIRPATSPVSRVHPLRIPETCAACHSDAERMKPYKIPTAQLEDYRTSVHFRALEGGDLSAPTCATCHGNHGAAPPGVASVERVCGTCHVFQEQLFDQSPHKAPWQAMGLAPCLACHSNHRIEATSDALLGAGEASLCARCHSEGDNGWKESLEMHARLSDLEARVGQGEAILRQAERAGMEVGEGFLTATNAREQLIKARVEVHAFNAGRVGKIADEGGKLAAQAQQTGEAALRELGVRRKGLGLSLIAIAAVVLGLWLLIRELEGSPARPR